jgi:hypothetical protein
MQQSIIIDNHNVPHSALDIPVEKRILQHRSADFVSNWTCFFKQSQDICVKLLADS